MYNPYRAFQCPYCYDQYNPYFDYYSYPYPYFEGTEDDQNFSRQINRPIQLKDYGPQPFTVNIEQATEQNRTFRTALWTGSHLQVVLMSINVGDDIGLEVHPKVDQFIRIEDGQGIVRMGKTRDRLDFQARVSEDSAIMIPAGTWHNVINTGNKPLKLYTIYAPPEHPRGVVNVNKPRR